MSKYDIIKEMYEKNNKLDEFNKTIENSCNVIQRQTDYSYDKSFEKLKEHDLSVTNVIKEYMGISIQNKDNKNKSTNQMMFDEFRNFLNEASHRFYKNKK